MTQRSARAGDAPASDDRPTIVFLHGTRLTGASWAPQLAELGGEFHCLTPDLPGHGTAADEPFTLAGAGERIAGLIAGEAHGGRAILVGLSLGGYVAMDVAARWPERVRGLVVSGATAEPVWPRAAAYHALALAFRRVPERVLLGTNRWFIRRRFPPAIAEPILAAGFAFGAGDVALRALVGERFLPRLAAYPGPSLLVNGEFDLFFRPAERSFAAVAADPRRVVIRRATHLANLDQPAAFSAAIRRFARSLPD
ncbi:MAG TPA: alpha/beta fold hydrolase [Candidatus Limnocylindrales bacterium]|nr:alpha/beta fold hydrolase [Candidatus Limnocylindrales bacterium]